MVDVVNRLMLKRSNYKSLQELYEEIHKQTCILMDNNYAISTYRSLNDDNVYVIEYAPMDGQMTDVFVFPVWLTPQEAKAVDSMRSQMMAKNQIPSAEDMFKWDSGTGSGGKGGPNEA